MMEHVRDVKLCLLGDTMVGKTSIVQRFVYDKFNPTMDRTIGAAFFSKTLTVNDVSFRYQIWDTAGQEKYKALAPMYYRDAAAAAVVFDITNHESFMSVKMWIDDLQKLAEPTVIVVVGNKSDLAEQRQVLQAEAEAFAANHGCLCLETSAKDAVNVGQLFTIISERLLAQNAPVMRETNFAAVVRPSSSELAKKLTCCGKKT